MANSYQVTGGIIPNLINGVSQQPQNIKFSNQADEAINTMPTLASQCGRRNPLEVNFRLSGVSSLTTASYIHWYRRDASESYEVFFNGTGIQVYSRTDGSQKTVTMSQPVGDTYHQSADPKSSFYCYTYKDTTWIVNRAVTCALKSALSSSRTPEGLIRVKDAVVGAIYKATVYVGASSTTATYTAIAGDTVSTIATQLRNTINTWITGVGIGGTSSIVENVIQVAHASSAIKLEVSDNRAGTAIASCVSTVQKLSDLPPYAPNGYILTVTGSSSSQNAQDQNTLDDVIYRFETDGGSSFAAGTWKEGVAPGIKYQIDAAAMPHQLVRKADGTFEYKQITWEERSVGDESTNPNPAFIGNTIHSVFLAGNRLGLNTGGIAVLSKTDEVNYYDFWKTTIATSLATDPITLPVPSSQVNRVYWAQQWNGELIIFGDNLDAAVSWQTKLSADEATVNTPTRFGCSTITPPIFNGASLFFVKNNGEYSSLYEYGINPSSALKDATELSEYVSTYVPKDVLRLVGNEKGFMVALCDSPRNKLSVYNYSLLDSRRLQQAFHTWEFNSDITILNIFLDGRTLGVTYTFQSNVYMGTVKIGPGETDTGLPWKVYLDARLSEASAGVTRSYSSGTNRTTFTVPYSYGSNPKTIVLREAYTLPSSGSQYPAGYILVKQTENSTTATVAGDWSGAKVYIGINYDSYYDPAPFVTYTVSADGKTQVTNPWQEINIHKVVVSYNNTAYFKIQVINRHSGEVVHEQPMRRALDNEETQFDTPTLYQGKLLVEVDKPQASYKIRLLNDSDKPSFFTQIAWTGDYSDGST